MSNKATAKKFEDLFGQKQLQEIFKKLSPYSYHEMASLFKQVQSTNSDEWLSYLKTLRYREKIKKTSGNRQWANDADAFESKIETRDLEKRVVNSKRLSPSPCSRAYYELA